MNLLKSVRFKLEYFLKIMRVIAMCSDADFHVFCMMLYTFEN